MFELTNVCVRGGGGSLSLWSLAHHLAHIFCVCFRDTSDLSAVCAYRVSDISRVFAEGKYKTPVPVETSFVKWVMYSGEVPVPRPGAVSLPTIQRVCACVRNKDKTQKATLFLTSSLAGSRFLFLP